MSGDATGPVMAVTDLSRPDWFGTPSCPCPACTDDEERGCAYVYNLDSGPVQCGLPGGHDGSCDAFEAPHEGNWKADR